MFQYLSNIEIFGYWGRVEDTMGMSPTFLNPISRIGIGLKSRWPWSKVHGHDLVTYLNHALIFEWYGVRSGSKNAYKEDTCSKEVGLCAQIMIIIIDSIGNIIRGDLYDQSMSTIIFTFIINNMNLYELQFFWGNWLWAWLRFVSYDILIACFMAYEDWASWKNKYFC